MSGDGDEMKKISNLVVRISIDTTSLEKQLSEFNELLSLSLEHCPDHLLGLVRGEVSTVLKDIVLTNITPTTGAGFDVIHRAGFSDKFERLASAVRARKFDIIVDGHY